MVSRAILGRMTVVGMLLACGGRTDEDRSTARDETGGSSGSGNTSGSSGAGGTGDGSGAGGSAGSAGSGAPGGSAGMAGGEGCNPLTSGLIWEVTFEEGDRYPNDVALDPDGNLFILVSERDPNSDESAGSVLKLSTDGELMWTAEYPVTPYGRITTDSDGNVYASGGWYAPTGEVVMLDPDGELVWGFNRTPSAGSDTVTVGGLAVSDAGEVWLASTDRGDGSDSVESWLHQLRNETFELSTPVVGADAIADLELDEEGGLLLTGHAPAPNDTGYSWVARYDHSGRELWALVGDDRASVGGRALAVGPDAFVVLAAEAELRVSKRGLDGALVWSRSLSSQAYDCAVALAPDGTVFVASSEPCHTCAGNDNDVRLTRYDPDGHCASHLSFGSATRPASDQGKGVVATDDYFIVVGALRPTPQTEDDRWDIAVRKYAR